MAKYVAERGYEAQNDYFALKCFAFMNTIKKQTIELNNFLFLFVSRQKENS